MQYHFWCRETRTVKFSTNAQGKPNYTVLCSRLNYNYIFKTKTWTTPEQRDFLDARRAAYQTIHDSGNAKYDEFWAQLSQEWAEAFPEIDVIFPGIPLERLTVEERAVLSLGIQRRFTV